MTNEIKTADTLDRGRLKINNAIKAFNETVVEGDSSVEAAQARVDTYGDSHETLKNRLDHEYEKMDSKKAEKSDLDDKANKNDLKEKADKKTFDDYVSDNDFKGVYLELTSNISIPTSTYKTIPWGGSVYNLSGFWSNSDPTKIIVPKGVEMVKVVFGALWESNAEGYRRMRVLKNGNYSKGLPYIANQTTGTTATNGSSAVVKVNEGDYFTLEVQQTSGESIDFREDPYTYFSLEVVKYSNPK